MLKFTATALNNSVELIWETANERKINNYEVQRSVDGKSFQSLGKVQSNTIFRKESNFYKYYDNQLKISEINTIFYYRLKIIENDANTYFSKIIGLNLESKVAKIGQFHPNPNVNGILKLEINNWKSTKVSFKIYSHSGKFVHSDIKDLNFGQNQLELFLPKLEQAVYLVEMTIANEKTYRKLFIR